MKIFDKVKILVSNPEYEKNGIFKGMVGTIIEAHIRFRSFQVAFIDPNQVVDENDDFLGLRDERVYTRQRYGGC
jgi:ATP-dependent exoDNAse (exonuclease V) alpha subunit